MSKNSNLSLNGLFGIIQVYTFENFFSIYFDFVDPRFDKKERLARRGVDGMMGDQHNTVPLPLPLPRIKSRTQVIRGLRRSWAWVRNWPPLCETVELFLGP